MVQSVPLGGEPAVKRAKRSDGSSINIDRSQVTVFGFLRHAGCWQVVAYISLVCSLIVQH